MSTGDQKEVMIVGIDDSEVSFYALEWTLDKFFVPFAPNYHYKLIIVHAKPSYALSLGLAGPGGVVAAPVFANDVRYAEAEMKKATAGVIDKAKEICRSKSVKDATVKVVEGDARNVLCETVEKHHASVLVVGSHGYGAIKRAVLGSVSDYVAHHAHCSVMIVKKPKSNR